MTKTAPSSSARHAAPAPGGQGSSPLALPAETFDQRQEATWNP